MKNVSTGTRLQAHFSNSLALARKISKREHRANPFVNILNITAKSTRHYPDLLGDKNMFWRFCNSLAGASIILWRASLYLNKKLPLCVPTYNLEVLLISHLTNPDHINDDTDFYFGDLATKLNVSGISTHTFLINHCQANVSHVGSMRRKKTTILPAFQSLSHEIFNILRLVFAALTLPKADAPIKNNRFHRLAKIAQFGSRAIGDYRIGQMISTVVKTLQPRVIIYTYEGHGWERIVAETAHNLAIPAHVIGYQHAVLFPGDKSLYHDHGRGTVPDHIFATGDVTRDILARNIKFCQGQITTIGSVKCQTSSSDMNSGADGICLFAPEGTLEEVHIMAKIAFDAAVLYPSQLFVLRLHPVIVRSDIDTMIAAWPSTPPNFALSAAPLNDDLMAASWICYRGSTVAFQGVLAGLRPIYLNPDNSVSDNNPVPEAIQYQRCAETAEDLIDIIQQDKNNPDERLQELPTAMKFASNYFSPFRPDIAVKYIKSYLK